MKLAWRYVYYFPEIFIFIKFRGRKIQFQFQFSCVRPGSTPACFSSPLRLRFLRGRGHLFPYPVGHKSASVDFIFWHQSPHFNPAIPWLLYFHSIATIISCYFVQHFVGVVIVLKCRYYHLSHRNRMFSAKANALKGSF